MLFTVQNSLVQMSDRPSLGNLLSKERGQHFSCRLCDIITPGSEWNKQLILLIKCHIAMHHSTESNDTDVFQFYTILFLHIIFQATITVLKTIPDILQTICPNTILQTILPFMTS